MSPAPCCNGDPEREHPPLTKKNPAKGNEPTTVVANDPEDRKGTLKAIGGSQSDHWNNTLANQAVQTLWVKNSDGAKRDRQVSAAVAALGPVEIHFEFRIVAAA
jgi:hypothetical protein